MIDGLKSLYISVFHKNNKGVEIIRSKETVRVISDMDTYFNIAPQPFRIVNVYDMWDEFRTIEGEGYPIWQ